MLEWLNNLFLGLNMPPETSEEELQTQLLDGALLCGILTKINPGYLAEVLIVTIILLVPKKLYNLFIFQI